MKKEFRAVYKFAVGFALIGFALWSCNDIYSDAGLGVLPVGDIVKVGKVIEQESIKSFTINDEKQRTDEPAYNLLGTYNDPVFGKTTADFACQLRLSSYPDFSKNAQADSLVLYLLYREIYGDILTPQNLKVYELDTDLQPDNKYYQDADLKGMTNQIAIGDESYIPKLKLDSLTNTYGSTKANPKDTVIQEIAIKLDLALANRLMALDSLTLSDNDLFLKAFKGLYVEAGNLNQGGTLMRIYTLATGSKMVLHYHNSEKDSLSFSFGINESTARISRFTHDYAGTPFAANLNKENLQDSLIYLQTTGGLRSKILIPELASWINLMPETVSSSEKIAINQAELIFQIDSAYMDTINHFPSNQLSLAAIAKTKANKDSLYYPSDYNFSPAYYGGVYKSSDKTYRFNIAKHMQDVMDGKKENLGFYLETPFKNSIYRRTVLKGASSKTGIRLEITYSIIK